MLGDIIRSEAIPDASNDLGVSRSLSDRHSVEQMASGLCGSVRLELIDEINEWNEAQEPFLVKVIWRKD